MPIFKYKGRNREGKIVSGTLEAGSPGEVASIIRGQGIFATDIVEVKGTTGKKHLKLPINISELSGKTKLIGTPKVKLRDLATFSRQLATLLNSGIPLISCMNIARNQAENKVLRKALGDITVSLEEGNTLADSFARFPGLFPEIFIFMVEAGELGGVLDEVLERLAEHFEREHEVNEKVKSAITYPIIVLVFAVLAVSFMLTFVLPKIIAVIQGMGVPLPLPTRIVMAVSGFFINYWYLIPFMIILLALVFKYIKSQPRGRQTLDQMALKIPVFGPVYQKIIVARFCRTLGTLLKGGVPIIQALEVVKKSTGNVIIEQAVTNAQESVRNGEELSKLIAECGVFPPMVTRMMAVGEETGALDTLLERVGVYYDKEVGIVVGRLSSVIEPMLIVLLGGIVGFIILAVMLPMMSSMMQGLS